MTIDGYLAELRLLLPSTRRDRFLREVDAHLREAADAYQRDGLDRAAAEARAVEAFGPATIVAERMRRETAPIAVRRAAGVALVALSVLFLPLYAVPENLLPPAPWPERPSYLSALLTVALGCWIGAIATTFLVALAPPRLAARGLELAAGLGLASGVSASTAAAAWHVEAPSTPWSVVAIALPLTVVAVGGTFVAALRARERAASSV